MQSPSRTVALSTERGMRSFVVMQHNLPSTRKIRHRDNLLRTAAEQSAYQLGAIVSRPQDLKTSGPQDLTTFPSASHDAAYAEPGIARSRSLKYRRTRR